MTPQHLGEMAFRGDEPADGPVCLAERAHADQTGAVHVEVLGRAAAGGAQHAGGVRIVDVDQGVVRSASSQHLRQRHDVAVLAEDAVADDDLHSGGAGLQLVLPGGPCRSGDSAPCRRPDMRMPSRMLMWLNSSVK